MDEKSWIKVCRNIQKSGAFPIPINDTVIELTKTLINEEEAKFLMNFRKSSLNMDQLKEKTRLDEESLKKMLNQLMNKGIIISTHSKSTGIKVFTLLPYVPGIFEYSFMKGGYSERKKKLAHLYEKLNEDLIESTQKNYDSFVDQYKNAHIMDRVVPVEEQLDIQPETVIPTEELERILHNFDDIAVADCYCRNHKELLDKHCSIDAPKENCFQLGKTAAFSVEHGFARSISKEEAMKILREAENAGLVHKVIHTALNPDKIEAAICNCCKDCCHIFQYYYRGITPIKTLTSYLARVDSDACIGCRTCMEKCPLEAPDLVDETAVIDESRCIGCGVCTHFCPEEAIKLENTGPRIVFVPPPKIAQN